MCQIFIASAGDDMPGEPAPPACDRRKAFETAFSAMLRAQVVQHDLLRGLAEGTVASDFGGACPDARIRAATRAAFEAEYAYKEAAHALMADAPYRLRITSVSLAVEMQARLDRNGSVAQIEADAARHADAQAAHGARPPTAIMTAGR